MADLDKPLRAYLDEHLSLTSTNVYNLFIHHVLVS